MKNNPCYFFSNLDLKSNVRFWLIFFLLTTQLHASKPLWQSKEYIKKAFFEVAYKNEYGKMKDKTGLVRWEKPIKYRIDYFNLPSPIEVAENLIQSHFQDLSDITGLSIHKNNKKPNFKIILTKKYHYKKAIKRFMFANAKDAEKLAQDTSCLVTIRTQPQGFAIRHAIVIIPVDYAMRYGFLPGCVVEELSQATGISNDSDWVNPSIANDKSVFDLLTGLDYLFLKILYDKRLNVGMTIEQSGPIIDKILLEFEKDKLIKNSFLEVKKLRMSQQLDL